jgi:hypothetical protein
MVRPLFGLLLEDVLTVWAKDIVAEAEVLVQHHGSFGDPLVAIFALLLVWTMHFGVFFQSHWIFGPSWDSFLWYGFHPQ